MSLWSLFIWSTKLKHFVFITDVFSIEQWQVFENCFDKHVSKNVFGKYYFIVYLMSPAWVATASVWFTPHGFIFFIYFMLHFLRKFVTHWSEIWPQCVDWAQRR